MREQEGSTGASAEVQLRTRGAAPGDDFESEVARAASEAEAGLRAGLRVALRTDEQHFADGTSEWVGSL